MVCPPSLVLRPVVATCQLGQRLFAVTDILDNRNVLPKSQIAEALIRLRVRRSFIHPRGHCGEKAHPALYALLVSLDRRHVISS